MAPNRLLCVAIPGPSQQRRERDEHKLAELKEEVTRLERAAEAETQRRVETGRALQDVSTAGSK